MIFLSVLTPGLTPRTSDPGQFWLLINFQNLKGLPWLDQVWVWVTPLEFSSLLANCFWLRAKSGAFWDALLC